MYISGLDKDFRCDSFPITDQVKALAYKVIHLAAKCTYHDCGSPALYTQRIIDGKPAPLSSEVIQVGGAESYQPRCHSCWIKERSE